MAIIRSLLDNDLYKFTMQQAVLHQFPQAEAEYKFILRKPVPLAHLADKVIDEVEALCSLHLTDPELAYLRSIRFLKADYVDFLENFTLKRRHVHVSADGDSLEISIKGPWLQTILFEVPLMAIVSELYSRDANPTRINFSGLDELRRKLNLASSAVFFNFADFGTRRRFSAEWHDIVVDECVSRLPDPVFKGTSNIALAMKYGVKPIGTMAHEFIQAGQGLGQVRLADSQKFMLEAWVKEYRGDLGIALTDTIGMSAFLRDFDLYFAKLYDGCRQDSGSPLAWGERLIAHFNDLGINPLTKVGVFTNALTFPDAIKIMSHFHNRLPTSFGIGTNLTNDCGIKPLNMVIKLTHINGHPVAKISDDPGKVICEDKKFLDYLMQVYNVQPEAVAL